MIIDLIMLVLISTLFFLFISSQIAHKSADSGVIRAQSSYIQRLMISTLQYQVKNGTYENATVLELLGRYHCGKAGLTDEINDTVIQAISELGKDDHYFIFKSESDSRLMPVFNNESCIKTENINIAKFQMDLPCSEARAEITLGIWPKTQEVEPC